MKHKGTRRYPLIYKLLTLIGVFFFASSGLIAEEFEEDDLDDEQLIADRDRGRPNLYDRKLQGRQRKYRRQRQRYYQRYYYPCPPYCPEGKAQETEIKQSEAG